MEIMDKQPNFFITDESSSMKSAIQSLIDNEQFSGSHALDSFHQIRNIRKRLKDK